MFLEDPLNFCENAEKNSLKTELIKLNFLYLVIPIPDYGTELLGHGMEGEVRGGPTLGHGSHAGRVSTEVTFWHSAEYGSDFRLNSGEIPRNSAEFRGISPEFSRNHFRSQKIPRNSVLAEFRGHPTCRPSHSPALECRVLQYLTMAPYCWAMAWKAR